MNILVTGAAGFIGFHVCLRLLRDGHMVTGIDNLNDYYDPRLKRDRLDILRREAAFAFLPLDLADDDGMDRLFADNAFTHVINLAAQAGVRYSLENPRSYVRSNLVGFANVLEGCRRSGVGHLVFASSSSVYGLNESLPFSETDNVDHPVSLYAASKKSNELMAHSYSVLYNIPCTGLRFFTVYGPWGRPDMALYIFTKAILAGEPIPVFNGGLMRRDFTYIDDVVEGVVRLLPLPPTPNPVWNPAKPDPASGPCPFAVYIIGNNNAVTLDVFISTLEDALGKKAIRNLLPMQPGDVRATYADIDRLRAKVGFSPATPLEEGIRRFTEWYAQYHTV